MNKQNLYNRCLFLFIPVLAIFCIGAFSSSQTKSTSLDKTSVPDKTSESVIVDWERLKTRLRVEDIPVENKTKAITLLSIEKEDSILKLRLRNDSDKVITAYQFSAARMTNYTECLTGTLYNNLFPPGDIREESCAIQTNVDTMGIKILGAIFEDGTDEGERESIKEMRQYRAGMKMYREKYLALLQDLVKSKKADIQSALDDIEADLPQIPEGEKAKMPHFVRSGLEDEQSCFLHFMRNLKYRDIDTQSQTKDIQRIKKQKLTKLIENYSKTLPQL